MTIHKDDDDNDDHNAVQSVWTVGVVLVRQPSRAASGHDLMKITQFDYQYDLDDDDKNSKDFNK